MRDLRNARDRAGQPVTRADEYIDGAGHLKVPVEDRSDPAPEREGWEPFWVSVIMGDPIQKVVSYRRIEE